MSDTTCLAIHSKSVSFPGTTWANNAFCCVVPHNHGMHCPLHPWFAHKEEVDTEQRCPKFSSVRQVSTAPLNTYFAPAAMRQMTHTMWRAVRAPSVLLDLGYNLRLPHLTLVLDVLILHLNLRHASQYPPHPRHQHLAQVLGGVLQDGSHHTPGWCSRCVIPAWENPNGKSVAHHPTDAPRSQAPQMLPRRRKGVSLPVPRLWMTPPPRPKTTRLPLSQIFPTKQRGRRTSVIWNVMTVGGTLLRHDQQRLLALVDHGISFRP